jgi:hypothetical protein
MEDRRLDMDRGDAACAEVGERIAQDPMRGTYEVLRVRERVS